MSNNPGTSILGGFNTRTPAGGPKVLPVRLDFTSSQAINVDLGQVNTLGKIGFVQSAYIDNSGNTASLTLVGSLLGQKIIVPAGAQMFTPLLLPNPPQMVASSTGNVIVPMFLLNVPMPFGLNPSPGSAMQVSDPALEALITNIGGAGNGLATYNINPAADPVNVAIISGGSSSPNAGLLNFTTQTFFNSGATSLSGVAFTGAVTVTGFDLSLDANASTGAGASTSNVGFFVGGLSSDTLLETWATVPAAPQATPIGRVVIASAAGLNLKGSATSPGLSGFWGGTSLATGAFRLNVWGFINP